MFRALCSHVLRVCSDFDSTVRGARFPTPHLKGTGFSSQRPGSRADFGPGPSPHPGATRQLRQTYPQRVKKSSQRDSFQGRALGSSEARRLSFSALQVNLGDDCHHSAIDCFSAAREAVTPTKAVLCTSTRTGKKSLAMESKPHLLPLSFILVLLPQATQHQRLAGLRPSNEQDLDMNFFSLQFSTFFPRLVAFFPTLPTFSPFSMFRV